MNRRAARRAAQMVEDQEREQIVEARLAKIREDLIEQGVIGDKIHRVASFKLQGEDRIRLFKSRSRRSQTIVWVERIHRGGVVVTLFGEEGDQVTLELELEDSATLGDALSQASALQFPAKA